MSWKVFGEFRFQVMAESNSFEMLRGLVLRGDVLSIQIEIGAPRQAYGGGVIGIPIDERDIPTSDLVLCQLRGRILPVAAASFADRLMQAMNAGAAARRNDPL